MYGINNFNFCRNGVAFLFVTLISFAFGQVPTTNTSVNISPYVPNTTYKVVGNSAVGGLNLSKSVITSSSSVQMKVGGGSVSVVRIDPKATINALPENKPFNARVGVNYSHDSLEKGFKNAFTSPNGIPMKMPKRGWFDVLASLPDAHSQACANGLYDVLCWGRLEKEVQGAESDLERCEVLHDDCSISSDGIYYSVVSEKSVFDESKAYELCSARVPSWTVTNVRFGVPRTECFYNGSSTSSGTVLTPYKLEIVVNDFLFCSFDPLVNASFCSSKPTIVENFVPFTPQDLDGIDLPLASMSDADFAIAQDNSDPFSISVDPIGSLVLGSTSSVDSDGNTTTETSTADVSINNNNSSSPSLETAITTETVVKDSSGNVISSNSSTTVVKEPPPSQIDGDFLTQAQLEQTWDRKDAEAKRDSENAKAELSAEGHKYDKMTEDLLKLLHVKEVDVNEVKEEYRFTFNASKQCPAPYVMNLNFFGNQISLNFDFSFFCEFVELFGLLVLASAYLTCAYIILGLRKI